MPKTFAVFGVTGHQGGSIINYVLNDPSLSQKYTIRAITRNISSEKAKRLKKKVEVIQDDTLDQASLEVALTDTHIVCAMIIVSGFGPDGFEVEFNNAKTIADIAVEKGVSYFIFSRLPSVSKMSSGQHTKVIPFNAKAKAEKYIHGLSIKSDFFAGDGTWVLTRPISSETGFPYIDIDGDTGKFVGAILTELDKYESKTFCTAERIYTLEEIAAILSRTTGKTVVYKQISLEEFKNNLSLPPFLAELFINGLVCQEQYGYFGPDSRELVAWAQANAQGRLTTLEYLIAHPLQLV
ncbi:hypothetical protein G7Y89_g6569 [Cudoniella acicularis]|uniref:NmrA-like domain-containing protein n=1 Tax=Cudoniella acicularis TaxID=354080 RepID=A0A8H4RMR4_9HELO|nr:hypothetical protein G7Y89_g6569 [Cudoniella acicularis]